MFARELFLSHAGVDKPNVVRPLAEALRRRGLSTWIDEGELAEGESLTDSVGQGLKRARFVVLVITGNFLDRRWPEAELKNALASDIRTGARRVLPVIATDRDAVVDRYPLLEDIFSFDWADGPHEIADRLFWRFERHPASWHIGYHPPDYTGAVWTRISSTAEIDAVEVEVLWHEYHYKTTVQVDDWPVSLLHHKTRPTDWPLYVRTDPPVIVTFGQGRAPDPSLKT